MQNISEARKAEITGALEKGDRITALRLYREATGADLKEAKEAIEEFEKFLKPGNERQLEAAGYDLAEQCRDKKISEEQAISEMKLRFPGFADAMYRSALSRGYFLSR